MYIKEAVAEIEKTLLHHIESVHSLQNLVIRVLIYK